MFHTMLILIFSEKARDEVQTPSSIQKFCQSSLSSVNLEVKKVFINLVFIDCEELKKLLSSQ